MDSALLSLYCRLMNLRDKLAGTELEGEIEEALMLFDRVVRGQQ